eukprot:1158256-Pelagomonas_calceolata.AAC.4
MDSALALLASLQCCKQCCDLYCRVNPDTNTAHASVYTSAEEEQCHTLPAMHTPGMVCHIVPQHDSRPGNRINVYNQKSGWNSGCQDVQEVEIKENVKFGGHKKECQGARGWRSASGNAQLLQAPSSACFAEQQGREREER